MRISTRQFGPDAEVDWTPMIDMTFQLIAFFMFVLNFSGAEVDERIKLPFSELAKPPEEAADTNLTLQLTEQGTVLLGGDEIHVDALGPALHREREDFNSLKIDPKTVTIIIRADGNARAGQVQRLIRLCQDEQFEKFVLRAKQRT